MTSASVRFNPAESRFGVFSLSPSLHCPFSALLEGTDVEIEASHFHIHFFSPLLRSATVTYLSCRVALEHQGPIERVQVKPEASLATVDFVAQEEGNGARAEEYDIGQFGYKPELERRFGLWSMIGLSCTIMVTWEGLLTIFNVGLQDGGPAGLIYGFLFCWGGYTAVVASLSELVSVVPTAGGQYHWTFELAPPKYRKFISYITGWQCVCAWQADLAAIFYLGGTIIQGLIVLNYPGYDFKRWHGTLLLWAVIIIGVIFNTLLVRLLPFIEASILITHSLGFIVVLVPLIYLGPHGSAHDVFAQYLTLGNYSPGLSWFVGLITTVFAFLGADGAIHMSEEVRNAQTAVPKALMASIFINGVLGFGMLVAVLFRIGSIPNALDPATGFTFIEVLTQALNSNGFATGLTAFILVLFIFCAVSCLAAASRVTWAFARDDGLPGSSWIKKVESRSKLPVNSIALSAIISMVLGLINIGSSVAFNAIVSLVIAAVFGSYFIPISMVAYRRLKGIPLGLGPWNMGRLGLPINIFALLWIIITWTFSFFPIAIPVTNETMNWSSVLWAFMMGFGILWYWAYQRHKFTGPTIISERFGKA